MKFKIWLILGFLILSIHMNAQHSKLAKLRTYVGITYYDISPEELDSYFLDFSELTSDLFGGASPQILYPSGLGSHLRMMYPSKDKLWLGVHFSYFRTDAALKYRSDQVSLSEAYSIVKYGSFEFIGRFLITNRYRLKPYVQAGIGSLYSKGTFRWDVEWNDQIDYKNSYDAKVKRGIGNSVSLEFGAESKITDSIGFSSSVGFRGGSGNTDSFGKSNTISMDHDGWYSTLSIFVEL